MAKGTKFMGYTPGVALSQVAEGTGITKHEIADTNLENAQQAQLIGNIVGGLTQMATTAISEYDSVQDDLLTNSEVLKQEFEGVQVYEKLEQGTLKGGYGRLTAAQDRIKTTEAFDKANLDPRFKERYFDHLMSEGGETQYKQLEAMGLIDEDSFYHQSKYEEFQGHMKSWHESNEKNLKVRELGIDRDADPFDEMSYLDAKHDKEVETELGVIGDEIDAMFLEDLGGDEGEFLDEFSKVEDVLEDFDFEKPDTREMVEWTNPFTGETKMGSKNSAELIQKNWDEMQDRKQETILGDISSQYEIGLEKQKKADMERNIGIKTAKTKRLKAHRKQKKGLFSGGPGYDEEGYSIDPAYMPDEKTTYDTRASVLGEEDVTFMNDQGEPETLGERWGKKIQARKDRRAEDKIWEEIDRDNLLEQDHDPEYAKFLLEEHAAWQNPEQLEIAKLLHGKDDISYGDFQDYYRTVSYHGTEGAQADPSRTTKKFDHLNQQKVLFDSIDPDLGPSIEGTFKSEDWEGFDDADSYYDMFKTNLQNK